MSIQAMKQALEALDDYYKHTGWESAAADTLRAAIEAAEKQEPVAWMSPGKERLEFSRPDTVYGSHTIPLYKHPVASQFSVGVIDSDGYLYPDHPLEPGTVLYTTPQPAIPAEWRHKLEHIIACAKLWDETGISRVKAITREAEAMLAAAPKEMK